MTIYKQVLSFLTTLLFFSILSVRAVTADEDLARKLFYSGGCASDGFDAQQCEKTLSSVEKIYPVKDISDSGIGQLASAYHNMAYTSNGSEKEKWMQKGIDLYSAVCTSSASVQRMQTASNDAPDSEEALLCLKQILIQDPTNADAKRKLATISEGTGTVPRDAF